VRGIEIDGLRKKGQLGRVDSLCQVSNLFKEIAFLE
jgi:hypothetical protein